jgi:hypothetical protein
MQVLRLVILEAVLNPFAHEIRPRLESPPLLTAQSRENQIPIDGSEDREKFRPRARFDVHVQWPWVRSQGGRGVCRYRVPISTVRLSEITRLC